MTKKKKTESDKQIYNSIEKSISKEEKKKKATRRQGLIMVGIILLFVTILPLISRTEISLAKETDKCKGFTLSIDNQIVPIKCYADYILLYDKYKLNYSDLKLKPQKDTIIIKIHR